MKIVTVLQLTFCSVCVYSLSFGYKQRGSVRNSLQTSKNGPRSSTSSTALDSTRRNSLFGILNGFSLPHTHKLLDIRRSPNTAAVVDKIHTAFPKAIPNTDLVSKATRILKNYGYGKTTLLATSLCSDEANRPLEQAFASQYGDSFSMGGLAGFPFAGTTGFGAMAHHVPDAGSAFLVYGPHVGVNLQGDLGTVERRGREQGGACCGSAATAYQRVSSGGVVSRPGSIDPLDVQQGMVDAALSQYADRLKTAEDAMVELPYCLFEAQDDMVRGIVQKSAGSIAEPGTVALLGGIQINTPADIADYFLPLRFEIRKSSGELLENLLLEGDGEDVTRGGELAL